MVEHNLAKVGVAGSSPVFRSGKSKPRVWIFFWFIIEPDTLVAEQVDAQDLKSCSPKGEYGFDSRLGYLNVLRLNSSLSHLADYQTNRIIPSRWFSFFPDCYLSKTV